MTVLGTMERGKGVGFGDDLTRARLGHDGLVFGLGLALDEELFSLSLAWLGFLVTVCYILHSQIVFIERI